MSANGIALLASMLTTAITGFILYKTGKEEGLCRANWHNFDKNQRKTWPVPGEIYYVTVEYFEKGRRFRLTGVDKFNTGKKLGWEVYGDNVISWSNRPLPMGK